VSEPSKPETKTPPAPSDKSTSGPKAPAGGAEDKSVHGPKERGGR
jgi:hypothetical protein